MWLVKAWTVIDWLLIIVKTDSSDKIKHIFFLINGRAISTICMNYLDTDKAYGEKVRQNLPKNVTSYTEQILEATSQKTAAVGPTTPHLWNHTNKTGKICRHCWRSKIGLISKVQLWTSPHGLASVRRPTRIYLQQLGVVIWYNSKDLPEAMNGRVECRERDWDTEVREICASRMIFWWWWCWSSSLSPLLRALGDH